jgi:hypothetical protein
MEKQLFRLPIVHARLNRDAANARSFGTPSITTLSAKDHLSDPPRPRSKRRFLSR